MEKKIIKMSGKAPKFPGSPRPFSPAVRAGDFIFVSGFHGGGVNRETGERYDTIEAQTRQCLKKISRALEAAGAEMKDAVKCTVFIHSADDFEKMNEVFGEFFPEDPPARSAVVTQFIRPGMLVQIDCIAYKPE